MPGHRASQDCRLRGRFATAPARLDIPDPWLGGIPDYELAYAMIAVAMDGLLTFIAGAQAGHGEPDGGQA